MIRTTMVRRPSPKQGPALETLGHAIEYLIDNYPMCERGGNFTAEFDAAKILKKASTAVFLECPEAKPFLDRLLEGFSRLRGKKTGPQQSGTSQKAEGPKRISGIHPVSSS